MASLLLLAAYLNTTWVRQGDFVLSVTTLAALEGGPNVVDVSLTYLGREPTTVRMYRLLDDSLRLHSLSPDYTMPAWRSFDTDSSSPFVDMLFSEGRTISKRYYLHQYRWNVHRGDTPLLAESSFEYFPTGSGAAKGEPTSVTLKKELRLKRRKADSVQLLDIQSRLMKLIHGSDKRLLIHDTNDWSEWVECRKWLENTSHSEFCPVALAMLDLARNPEDQWFSFDYLIKQSGSIEAANRVLISELKKPGLGSAGVFVAWRHPRFRLPSKDQVHSVLEARNPWVRALVVGAFPQYTDARAMESVRRQIKDHLVPEPTKEFETLLLDFDNARYQTRESATRKLTAMGEPGERMVIRALAGFHSAESTQRLELVLRQMALSDPNPESLRVIRALEQMASIEAKELVNLIAEGPARLRSTCEAKKVIERRRGGSAKTAKE